MSKNKCNIPSEYVWLLIFKKSGWDHIFLNPYIQDPLTDFISGLQIIVGNESLKCWLNTKNILSWYPKHPRMKMVGNQLDDSKPLLGKWMEMAVSPNVHLKNGCLGV